MKISNKVNRLVFKAIAPFLRNYMPRKVILLIDVCIVLFAAKVSALLVSSIQGEALNYLSFPKALWIVTGIQVVFILIFKSYTGLVRYSSLDDVIKLFKVVGMAQVSILILNQILRYTRDIDLMADGATVMFGVITFSLLFFFRAAVKGIYGLIYNNNFRGHALVLGVDRADIDMASGLLAQQSNRYKITGFVTTEEQGLRNRIFGLPIFTIQRLQTRRKLAGAIIIREDKLKLLRQTQPQVFSDLLELKFKILKMPNLQTDLGSGTKHKGKFSNLREINIEDLLQRDPISLDTDLISQNYRGKTIMVTGGAGSIGSEIVRQLIPFKPKKILLVDQAETPLHSLTLELDKDHPHVKYEKLIANVRNRRRMQRIFEQYKPEIVFHAAAYKHVPMMEANAIEAISTNFQGTRNVADLAVAYNIEKFVFVSTDKAVNPTNIMGATKRSAELYIQYLVHTNPGKTNFMTTRFGNVLGSNGSVVPYFKTQIAAGGPITVTHPEITRYFMTIDEACQLVLQAGSMGHGGEIFVFDMGRPVKIVDLAKQMIRLSGLKPERDIKIEFVGLRPEEKLYEELLADKENTAETLHEKIMIGNPFNPFTDGELFELSNAMSTYIADFDTEETLSLLKTMVPEYHCEADHDIEDQEA